MELNCGNGSFKVARTGSLLKTILILLIHLQLETAGPHNFFNVTLNIRFKSLVLSQMIKSGHMILIISRSGLRINILEQNVNLSFRIKIYETLMRQDFALV